MMGISSRRSNYLYKSRGHAMAAETKAAEAGSAFGVSFTTPADRFGEIWEIWGDGRRLVSFSERKLFVLSLLGKHGFLESSSTAQQVGNFIFKNAFSLAEPSASLDRLGSCGQSLMGLCRDYFRLLDEAGLAEPLSVFPYVCNRMDIQSTAFGESFGLHEPWSRIFTGMPDCKTGNEAESLAGIAPDNISFVITSGESARVPAAVRLIDEYALEGKTESAVWVASRPLDAVCALNSMASAKDICIDIAADVPFIETSFGKFVLSVCNLVIPSAKPSDWRTAAADIALSVYSGITSYPVSSVTPASSESMDNMAEGCIESEGADGAASSIPMAFAKDFDTLIRRDRLLTKADAVRCLSAISPGFAAIASVLEDSDAMCSSVSAGFRQTVFKEFSGISAKCEEAALGFFVSVLEEAYSFGIAAPIAADSLFGSSFRLNASETLCSDKLSEKGFSVCISSYGAVGELAPRSFGLAIIDDVSTERFSPSEEWGFLERASEMLGTQRFDTSADDVRESFADALRLSDGRLVCMYSLRHGMKSSDSFPSFPLDEMLKGLFGDKGSIGSIVEAAKAAPSGAVLDALGSKTVRVISVSERDICAGIGWRTLPRSVADLGAAPSRGCLDNAHAGGVCLSADGPMGCLPRLSASAIERYLQCPYGWFIERRIGMPVLDEGFGPIERGTFAHSVFERFYSWMDALPSDDRSVADMPESEMRMLFDRAFQEVADAQLLMEGGSGRYVPVNANEALEFQAFKERLFNALVRQKRIPGFFKIYANENIIDLDEQSSFVPIYGGAYIKGMIDRIDICPEDRTFAIFDYKGSNKDHQAGSDEFCFVTSFDMDGSSDQDASTHSDGRPAPQAVKYPDYIQTLLYAQIQKRKFESEGLDFKPVGATYLGYNKSDSPYVLEGSVSSTGALSQLAGPKSQVPGDFSVFLDDVENLIAARVSEMDTGAIGCIPHSKLACKWCPFEWCEDRI